MLLLTIGLGGMAGTWARFQVSGWIYDRTGVAFPWGTLSVNVSGSVLLGALLHYFALRPATPSLYDLAVIGFVGAFTTFSTFAYEAVMLVQAGQYRRAIAYVAASVALGLLGVLTGLLLGRVIF